MQSCRLIPKTARQLGQWGMTHNKVVFGITLMAGFAGL